MCTTLQLQQHIAAEWRNISAGVRKQPNVIRRVDLQKLIVCPEWTRITSWLDWKCQQRKQEKSQLTEFPGKQKRYSSCAVGMQYFESWLRLSFVVFCLLVYNICLIWYSVGGQAIGHVVPSKPGYLCRGECDSLQHQHLPTLTDKCVVRGFFSPIEGRETRPTA